MQIEVGSVVQGKVSGITSFGAFVELGGGKTGLVHISEVSTDYVSSVGDCLKEGQEVKVKVMGTEKGKISLSIKQVLLDEGKGKSEKRTSKRKNVAKNDKKGTEDNLRKAPEEFDFGRSRDGMSFDDMLQRFKQDSDEKFQDLKRSNDGKRSGGYKRSY